MNDFCDNYYLVKFYIDVSMLSTFNFSSMFQMKSWYLNLASCENDYFIIYLF